jgi:hypothetical protein
MGKTAEEIREEAMQDPLLRAIVEGLEAQGARLMSEDEVTEFLQRELTPEEQAHHEAVNSTLLQMELRERDGDLAWRPEMGEVSGFGGGYELCCRAMLRAGVRWLREHPDAKPVFKGFAEAFGICIEDNEAAKQLSEAVLAACPGGGASGAMHQATVTAALWIHGNGWERYCEEMSKRDDEEEEP